MRSCWHNHFSSLLVLAAMAASLMVFGCQATKTSDRSLTHISPDEAATAIQGERKFFGGRTTGVWVDARSRREYDEGHIPGAIHMPIETTREDHHVLRDFSPIIVYGRDRAAVRASALSKLLMELRHRDVRTLRGGIEAWRAAGYPVE